MASGVFGTPISEKTVIATGEYKEPITQKDVADYAMKMINAGGKDINAQTFVDNLKERFVCFFLSFIVRRTFLLLACCDTNKFLLERALSDPYFGYTAI